MTKKNERKCEIETPLSVEIMRLMARGATNDRIFMYMAWEFPTAIDNEDLRIQAGKAHLKWRNKGYVPYDVVEKQRLQNLIHVLRVQFKKEVKHRSMIDQAIGEGDVITPLSMVQEVPTTRFTTGYIELDQVFGSSRRYNDAYEVVEESHGIARGKLSLIAGESGVGKTKYYVAQAIKLAEDYNLRVLIFQKEYREVGEFKALIMDMYRSMRMTPHRLDNIMVRRDRNYQDQVKVIRDVRPDLVVDDSYNLTHGAETKQGIEDIVFFWKDAMGSHSAGWMIAHLNERGGFKGNNHVRYLVDAAFRVTWADKCENEGETSGDVANRFKIMSGKNRGGKKDQFAYLRHIDDHIVVLPTPEREEVASIGGEDEKDEQ